MFLALCDAILFGLHAENLINSEIGISLGIRVWYLPSFLAGTVLPRIDSITIQETRPPDKSQIDSRYAVQLTGYGNSNIMLAGHVLLLRPGLNVTLPFNS